MSLTIKEVTTSRDVRRFIEFPFTLYEGSPWWVPPFVTEEKHLFDPAHNASLQFCRAKRWLALRDGKVVGRIAAIVNPHVNEVRGERYMRFSHMDFVDDTEVSRELLRQVEIWARQEGMNALLGPLAFTDMDQKGILVEGFGELATLAGPYNYPYYAEHLQLHGYAKEVDWIEFQIKVPDGIPDKMARIAEIAREKSNVRVLQFKQKKDMLPYADQIFHVLNEAYKNIYGFAPLTQEEIAMYIKLYFGFVQPEYVVAIVDENNRVVAFGITMPSLSRVMQKAKARLTLISALPLYKAMKQNDTIDLYLIGVLPEYQKKGVNALLFTQLIPICIRNGIKLVETNHELESNIAVQQQWKFFDRRMHKRRRCYRKSLEEAK